MGRSWDSASRFERRRLREDAMMNVSMRLGAMTFGLRRWARVAWVLTICPALVGCGGIGPRSIANDRFDYTETLSVSWKQQMLANMVKLRYGDTPVFLDVA